MRTVIQGWSGFGFLARLAIAVLTGVTWAVCSVQQVLVQPDSWNPVSQADWFAVYSYSVAWLITAISLLILREVARQAPGLSTSIVVASAGSAVAGIGNLLEHGLSLKGFGAMYVTGVLVGGLGLFFVAARVWVSPVRSLTFVAGIGGIAVALVTVGGGVLGLVAWLGLGAILTRERVRPTAAPSTA